MKNRELSIILEDLRRLLGERSMRQVRQTLEDLNTSDVADLLAELQPAEMATVFRLLSKETASEVFAHLEIDEQRYIIESVTDKELSRIIEELFVDDAVEMMTELPANVVLRVMRAATSETRELINRFLNYPENSAGRIMTAEFVDLKRYMSVKESIARIRRIGDDKETIYNCYVTSSDRKLEGAVTVRQLLLADDEAIIGDIMSEDTSLIFVRTTDDQEQVTEVFSRYDLLAVPVVDSEHRLVGIVTVDDVIDVIEEEATEDIEKMAALLPSDKPYLKTSVITHVKQRIPWLLILMFSSVVSGAILTNFEHVYTAVPLLVALMPMLTDTGGNAGAQASTLIIRGMAVGEISSGDIVRILWKEIRISVLCGLILAGANFVRIVITYPGESTVGFVMCSALFCTVVLAKCIGCMLPIVAKVCKLDPALVASPLITTVVDAVGLSVYFMIAIQAFKLAP